MEVGRAGVQGKPGLQEIYETLKKQTKVLLPGWAHSSLITVFSQVQTLLKETRTHTHTQH